MAHIITCLIIGLTYVRPNTIQLKQNSILLMQQNPSKQNNFGDFLEDASNNIILHCVLMEMKKYIRTSEYAISQKA